jgi:hypothetical protein
MGKRINEMIGNGANVLFLCLANDSFWPVGDAHCHEIMTVRAAASDPKRTFVFLARTIRLAPKRVVA